MPPPDKINKDFFKLVFAGKKDLIPRAQLRPVEVPQYDELSVAKLYPEVMKVPEYAKFFPENCTANTIPTREYFFNVMNTVAPEYITGIIEHAQKLRFGNEEKKDEQDVILITEQWQKDLEAKPFFSSKTDPCLTRIESKGRTLMLLKQGSRTVHRGFKRKQVELLQLPKAFKDASGKITMVNPGQASGGGMMSQGPAK